jgi:hypothetical protein
MSSLAEGRAQILLAEWLEQTVDGALCEKRRTNALASLSGDENDRDLPPATHQLWCIRSRLGASSEDRSVERQGG